MLNKAAIDAFKYNFGVLVSGKDTMIGESALDPVDSLTTYESLPSELGKGQMGSALMGSLQIHVF